MSLFKGSKPFDFEKFKRTIEEINEADRHYFDLLKKPSEIIRYQVGKEFMPYDYEGDQKDIKELWLYIDKILEFLDKKYGI